MAVAEVAKVITNWREAALDNQERAMLGFTEKFTLTPSQITDADIEALRKAGIGYHEIVAGHTTPSELRSLVEKLVPAG